MAKTVRVRITSTARPSGKNVVVKTTTSVNGSSKTKTTVVRGK